MAQKDQITFNKSFVSNPGPYLAKIINVLDPEYMGTLQVQLLKSNTSGGPDSEQGNVFNAKYLSPFAGQTPLSGSSKNEGYRYSQQSYGFWAIPPDVGTIVLVIFAEGNPNQCYWLGCVQDRYQNFAMPGQTSTTYTTEGTPGDLVGKKIPTVEYNKKVEEGQGQDPTQFLKPYQEQFVGNLQEQGLIEDEARGISTSSARREVPSAVFGISTPGPIDKRSGAPTQRVGTKADNANVFRSRLGGTEFIMDDGDDKFLRRKDASSGSPDYAKVMLNEDDGDPTLPFNELVRLRTRTGHQILLHNTEDLIYIANSRGTAWIELTSDGKIDVYAKDSISLHTENDFNLTADRNVTIEAGANISMKASGNYVGTKSSIGNIQIESLSNTSILVGGDTKITTIGDYDVNTTGHNWLTAGKTTEILSGKDHIETASNIHMNGPQASTAALVQALNTHGVPGHEINTILAQRSPQHEPWSHHENLNPLAFKIALTDRDNTVTAVNPLPTPTTPDPFKKQTTASLADTN
jgi:hypothetical protein